MEEKKAEKKKSPAWIIWLIGLWLLAGMSDGGFPRELLVGIAAVIVLAVIVVLIAKKKKQQHTHDRIDHRSDLKIDQTTGRVVEASRRRVQPHSPQEHWKQQMDDLLANGTIDRAEYRAMLNRKF